MYVLALLVGLPSIWNIFNLIWKFTVPNRDTLLTVPSWDTQFYWYWEFFLKIRRWGWAQHDNLKGRILGSGVTTSVCQVMLWWFLELLSLYITMSFRPIIDIRYQKKEEISPLIAQCHGLGWSTALSHVASCLASFRAWASAWLSVWLADVTSLSPLLLHASTLAGNVASPP